MIVDQLLKLKVMVINQEQTEVIFRKTRLGEIIALFPYIPEFRYSSCMSYMHIGQHGTAYLELINTTKLASSDEYQELFNELEGLGYKLKVLKKMSWRKYSNIYHSSKPVKIK